MNDPLAIRDQALEVGRGWSGPSAPASWALTAALFDGLANDDDLLAIAGRLPPERLPALLFVAGVHATVRVHPDDPLASYFPIVGRELRAVDADLTASYRRFGLDRADEIIAACTNRMYQMNEVARCAQTALALADLEAASPGQRVGLVDVGTGAGLGLYPDRYGFRFSDGTSLGDLTADVIIDCEVLDGRLPSARQLPVVTRRIGIDLHPVDLADPDARAWLAACIPPEPSAVERFAAASAFVAGQAPRVLAGAAADALPGVLDELTEADDVDVIVVVDTFTAVFFQPDELARFDAAIARRSGIVWVSLDPLVPLGTDARRTVQGVDAPDDLVAENRAGGVFGVLSVREHAGGPSRILATAHPSGTRMRWLLGA